MKKLITILLTILSFAAFGQNENGQYKYLKLTGLMYNNASGNIDTIIAVSADTAGQFILKNISNPTDPLDAVNLRYFNANATAWDSITALGNGYAYIYQSGAIIDSFECITLSQMMDTIATLPGGHDALTVSTTGTNNGLSVDGSQVLTLQSAGTSQAGALTSGYFNIFFDKLSAVSHDLTLSGNGTAPSLLRADTLNYIVSKQYLANKGYLGQAYRDYDSLTNTPTIPTINNDAYNFTTWDADVNNGASRSAIANAIAGSGGGGATNLTYSAFPDSGRINSDTGTECSNTRRKYSKCFFNSSS